MKVPKGKITEIYVQVLNWEKYNPRKDVKLNSWFRFDHSLFERPEFINFTHTDIIVWIYLLCLCSKKNTSTVTIYTAHAERIAQIPLLDLISGLQKLNDIKAITFNYVTCTIRERLGNDRKRKLDVTSTCSTVRYDTVQTNKTEQDGTKEVTLKLPPLAVLWNELSDKKLHKVFKIDPVGKRGKAASRRWESNPDPEYWKSVISKINQSQFCLGENDRGWKASFDWLVQPDTADKVLEDKYNDWNTKPKLRKGIAELMGVKNDV